ncbi:zinc finger BED domain-containing protein RICESLEEPER 1-like [Papaver somniferum]|uniref:zinc finger BED domain-containing protein RICESLEEPER 1-like n=1 Tax=Papaver somniferum TaxID=3469 RepID=UPI000E6F836D|nr:zinc finger BED domain-containing protein RICESLEEPER 1-like [Papaver somniferum]
MKSQTGSSVGGHCVPVKKTKVTVSKSPYMPPPKAAVSKAAKKNLVPSPTRKHKRTSKYWAEFQEVLIKGKTHGECKHCKRNIGAESKNGTSSLRKHLNSCMAYKGAQQQINQMFLKASETQDGSVAAYNFKFNQEATRDCIARMIILHELPFSFVEYIGFRRVLTSLQPNIKLVKRNTTKSDCIKIYQMEKKHLYEIFSKIQKRILSFNVVDGQHTGVNIAKVLIEQLYKWNIDRKIASITLDNASTNKVMVSELLAQLKPDNGLLLDGELFHVRCSAHVVAIIVDHGMLQIKEEIQKIRNSVKFIRDWKNASSLSICLKFFYEVTILFSVNMMKKFEIYWQLTSKTFAIASILDPRFKMKLLDYYFPLIYPGNSEEKKLEVMEVLKRLYNEYATHYASSAHVYSANISTNQVNMEYSVGSSGSTSSSQSSFTSRRKGLTAFLEESSQHDVVRTDIV